VIRLAIPGLLACALLASNAIAQPLAEQERSPVTSITIPALNTAPLAGFSNSASALRDSIVALARAQLGTRYVLGGTNPNRGFDCSGLISFLARALNLDVPRTADQQSRVGQAVATDRKLLRPGDLLTFGSSKRVSHIGIYIGDGKFIHASTGAGKVIVADMSRPNYLGGKAWTGVRRLIMGDSADAGAPKRDG